MVFATPLRQFYRGGTNPARLPGLYRQDSSIWTGKHLSVYRDLAKTPPALTQTATNQTAGPLVQMETQNWPPTIEISDENFNVDNAFAPLLSI